MLELSEVKEVGIPDEDNNNSKSTDVETDSHDISDAERKHDMTASVQGSSPLETSVTPVLVLKPHLMYTLESCFKFITVITFSAKNINLHLQNEYTGYVDFVDCVAGIPEYGKLFRMVLNNNDGYRMMVTSWKTYIQATLDVAEVGNVLEIRGLMVKHKEDTRNNLGSGKCYFETQAITSRKILGKMDNLPIDCGICKIDFDKIEHAQGIICIEGTVKTAPRLQKSSIIGNRIVGGIINGERVLEITLPEDQKVDDVLKGERVKVIRAITRKTHGLHVLKVANSEDIIKISGLIMDNVEYFINAYIHV
ncbi:hypothetical protein QAD02_014992 [Eretmocerus hayati]|uniref:Uncharacterized protein n=1 Tax=Eretmocerus hayati TaxID=131215 RepID=A0ACC2P700_9HYME|nr:hypothetical protein QAD02_014992 [Eretmocerus hayati]